MNEKVCSAIVGCDEAETFFWIEPFYCTCTHFVNLGCPSLAATIHENKRDSEQTAILGVFPERVNDYTNKRLPKISTKEGGGYEDSCDESEKIGLESGGWCSGAKFFIDPHDPEPNEVQVYL